MEKIEGIIVEISAGEYKFSEDNEGGNSYLNPDYREVVEITSGGLETLEPDLVKEVFTQVGEALKKIQKNWMIYNSNKFKGE